MAIKTELINVTPELARQWLEQNINNRPIRESHVDRLCASFKRGEYHTTHQGICFDETGELLDGQHRLAAIARMPDGSSFPMLVSRGFRRDQVFHVIDTVQVQRNIADSLGVPRPVAEVARMLVLAGQWHGTVNATPEYVAPVCVFIQDEVQELLDYCPRAARLWSSTPSRAAAVVMMKRGNREFAKRTYKALIQVDVESMAPAALALFKSAANGHVSSHHKDDLFVRCLRAYNPHSGDLRMLKVTGGMIDTACTEVRTWLYGEVPELLEGKKKTTSRPNAVPGLPGSGARRAAG